MDRFEQIPDSLTDRLNIEAAAQEYERDARALRIMAKAMHEFGWVLSAEEYDSKACKAQARANQIRRFARQATV